jgi:hypothetical protein
MKTVTPPAAKAPLGDVIKTLFFPIEKKDAETRTIRGVMTSEVLDQQGDIVDYDAAKAAVQTWKGNIREMHDKTKAVGKRVDVEFDDVNRRIILEAQISKGAEDTWLKIQDGTLSMFSIAGPGERIAAKANGVDCFRVLMKKLFETSVVDNGACPDADFDIVKALAAEDDAPVAKREISDKMRDTIPAEDFAGPHQSFPIKKPEDITAAAHAVGEVKTSQAARDLVKRKIIAIAYRKGDSFVKALPEDWKKKEDQTAEKLVTGSLAAILKAVRAEPYDLAQALQIMAALEMLLANEAWEANQDAAAGDTDSPEAAEVQALRLAFQLLLEFITSEFEAQFEDGEEDDAEPEAGTPAAIEMVAKCQRGRRTRVQVFSKRLKTLLSATGISKAGARHSAEDLKKVQSIHDTAHALGGSCATEKSVTKAGARHSKGDLEKVQSIHDDAKGLGADCDGKDDEEKVAKGTGDDDPPTGDDGLTPAEIAARNASHAAEGTKGGEVKTDPPAPGETTDGEDVKALKALIGDVTKALEASKTQVDSVQATMTAQAATIADLQATVEKFAKSPRPGGPMTRATATAVQKTIGGVEGGGEQDQSAVAAGEDEYLKAIDTLALAATTPQEKADYAAKRLTYMRQRGIGRMDPVTGRPIGKS